MAAGRLPEAQTRAFCFATLVVGNLALILSHRSRSAPLWQTLRVPNPRLWWVIGGALLLLLTALYLPWAAGLLRFGQLPLPALGAAMALGLLSVGWFEGVKWARRRHAAA